MFTAATLDRFADLELDLRTWDEIDADDERDAAARETLTGLPSRPGTRR